MKKTILRKTFTIPAQHEGLILLSLLEAVENEEERATLSHSIQILRSFGINRIGDLLDMSWFTLGFLLGESDAEIVSTVMKRVSREPGIYFGL